MPSGSAPATLDLSGAPGKESVVTPLLGGEAVLGEWLDGKQFWRSVSDRRRFWRDERRTALPTQIGKEVSLFIEIVGCESSLKLHFTFLDLHRIKNK